MKYLFLLFIPLIGCMSVPTIPQSQNVTDSTYTGFRTKGFYYKLTDALPEPDVANSIPATVKIIRWDSATFMCTITTKDAFNVATTEEIATGKNQAGQYTGNASITFVKDTIIFLEDFVQGTQFNPRSCTETKVWKQ